ncbi:MAG TPA: uroporphyrinogen decarboxylase [Candidatus Paceibacterota bacterium]|nr:uroporphyrinogen decarboxylase [Candidatus Paceibacterota bacterium]
MTAFDDTFLKACRSEPTDHVPVWFMRQAGRSLPGYRALREKHDVLTLARTPELAVQISMEPIGLLGVDAAILFADIMLLPLAMGVDLHIVDSVGPVIEKPIASTGDIDVLPPLDPAHIDYLAQTIKILRGQLAVPLIGFSGAPFTLASYLIEGKPTRQWIKTKRFMMEEPRAWARLMEKLSAAIVIYLSVQIDAGAQAIQLFDSWVGCLSPSDYRKFVLPYTQSIFSALKQKNVPRIHFGTDTGAMLHDFSNVDCEVIGLDWRVDIGYAKTMIGRKAIQGNLDPVVLLGDEKTIKENIDRIFLSLSSRNGFIFNLGHGMLPETDDQTLKRLVAYVHGK